MTSTVPTQDITATPEAVADQNIPKIWHAGSCHCEAVKFEVLHESLYLIPGKTVHVHVISCNCSICLKNGYLLIYPERGEIKWLSGWDTMKTYQFGTKTRDHRFCGVCGSSVGIDFLGKRKEGDLIGLNARLIKDIDMEKLKLRKKNGKDWWPEQAKSN